MSTPWVLRKREIASIHFLRSPQPPVLPDPSGPEVLGGRWKKAYQENLVGVFPEPPAEGADQVGKLGKEEKQAVGKKILKNLKIRGPSWVF